MPTIHGYVTTVLEIEILRKSAIGGAPKIIPYFMINIGTVNISVKLQVKTANLQNEPVHIKSNIIP